MAKIKAILNIPFTIPFIIPTAINKAIKPNIIDIISIRPTPLI